ncbi:MAG TPA: SRPBCC family protein [Candidatus Thermoplasmatota archaeon]|nr:SRPBCC family protein [Candidatus Thermoplasmatota archaeon]
MERIEKTIVCEVPVTTAYNQWTQFEEFPQFMEGIVQVDQLDDKRLHWVADVAGDRKEWDAEIIDQVPDQVIAWRSITGETNHGSVKFRPLAENRCEITLLMTYEPKGIKEKIGDMLGILNARVEGDLQRFKKFIEERQVETGAWRGEIEGGSVNREGRPSRMGGRTHRRAKEEQEYSGSL